MTKSFVSKGGGVSKQKKPCSERGERAILNDGTGHKSQKMGGVQK